MLLLQLLPSCFGGATDPAAVLWRWWWHHPPAPRLQEPERVGAAQLLCHLGARHIPAGHLCGNRVGAAASPAPLPWVPRGSAQPRCYLCAAAPAGIPRHPDKNKHLNVKAAAWGFVAVFGAMSLSADKNIAAANLERALRRRRQQNKPRAPAHSDTGQPCPASIPSARFGFCVPSRGASQLRPQHITLPSPAACFSAGCTQISIKTPPQQTQLLRR